LTPSGLRISPSSEPLVGIVTPSFNQARYLRETIESVLAQSYPRIDYLVVDGGSTDGSVDVLRAYGDRVRWISEPDRGQADAIAKGFARTPGEILAWINSDDLLLPDSVAIAVEAFGNHPGAGLVYGQGELIDGDGNSLGPFPWIEPHDPWRLVYYSDYVLQPSTFFRRSAYEAAGGLDTSLHYAMDWDLWIRLAAVADVVYLERDTLARARIWDDNKTSTGRWRRIAELARLSRRHAGRSWTPGVQRYALDTLGRDLRRWLPGPLLRLARRWGAVVDRRIVRRVPLHEDGWLGPRGELLFPRRWGGARLELEVPGLPPGTKARIEVRLDGRTVASRPLEGAQRLAFELPAEQPGAPFCRIELESSYSLLDEPTRRQLSMRRLRLDPL
jgi:glycosyltransferase involved in cell wall biosynthesis